MTVTRNHGLVFFRSQPFSSLERSKLASVMALPVRTALREVPQTTVMVSTGEQAIEISLPFISIAWICGPMLE